MWLLRTDRAELCFFNQPPARYAILSHVWTDSEQSFQEVQNLPRSTIPSDRDPRSYASPKIRDACIYAESHDFQWLWIDTCCIDKTSSAELSEAINSMYQWYAGATICFVYLQDVGEEADVGAEDSSFRRSIWFTRGWTLQELIAPRRVIFLSRKWYPLGDKEMLAKLLEEITDIDMSVLTFSQPMTSVSVMKRMSWASRRQTTRIEDAAYSLMGIFDVNLPTIYGEGSRAFRRLQEEIMKNSTDHTLFTWGPRPLYFAMPEHPQSTPLPDYNDYAAGSRKLQNLLADSPSDFASSSSVVAMPGEALELALTLREIGKPKTRSGLWSFLSTSRTQKPRSDDPLNNALRIPEFTVTSLGIRARLPIIEGKDVSVAVLACQSTRMPGTLLGLVLRRGSIHTALYQVGAKLFVDPDTLRLVNSDLGLYVRCILLDSNDKRLRRLFGVPRTAPVCQWKDIYIQQHTIATHANADASIGDLRKMGIDAVAARSTAPWIAISHGSIALLQSRGFKTKDYSQNSLRCIIPSKYITYTFLHAPTGRQIKILVGHSVDLHADDDPLSDPEQVSNLWVTVEFVVDDSSEEDPTCERIELRWKKDDAHTDTSTSLLRFAHAYGIVDLHLFPWRWSTSRRMWLLEVKDVKLNDGHFPALAVDTTVQDILIPRSSMPPSPLPPLPPSPLPPLPPYSKFQQRTDSVYRDSDNFFGAFDWGVLSEAASQQTSEAMQLGFAM